MFCRTARLRCATPRWNGSRGCRILVAMTSRCCAADDPMLAQFTNFAARAYPANGKVASLALFCRDIEVQFPSPEHSAHDGYYPSPDHFLWGGTEEFVIAKGSDWCAELARVFCALCELSGISARIVFALDGSADGHVLAECHVDDEWMLVDPLAAKLYEDSRLGRVGAARMHQLTGAEKRVLTASAENYYRARAVLPPPLGVRILDSRRGLVRLRTESLQRVLPAATVRPLERGFGAAVSRYGEMPRTAWAAARRAMGTR